MAMQAVLQELPPRALRALYDFIHAPGLWAEPERVRALLPDGASPTDDAALDHQLIRESLSLGDADEFDPADPLHRTALLPREALAIVSWRLGLASHAPRVFHLIRRDDVAQLNGSLSEQDWQFIADRAAPQGRVGDAARESRSADLPQTCREAGWQALERACDTLPHDIGQRLRLKLPMVPAMKAPPPVELTPAQVARLCVAAASDWDPQWDAAWSAHAASA